MFKKAQLDDFGIFIRVVRLVSLILEYFYHLQKEANGQMWRYTFDPSAQEAKAQCFRMGN